MNNERNKPPRQAVLGFLVLASLLIASSPVHGATPPTSPLTGSSCVDFEDDPGMGGSTASCRLDCSRNEALIIGGAGMDQDASIVAAVNCGGASAGCWAPSPVCAASSGELTNYADDGKCKAETDEWWSSMVYVACASIQVLPRENDDPLELIWDNVGGDYPPCREYGGAEACAALAGLADPVSLRAALDALLTQIPEGYGVTGFVLIAFNPDVDGPSTRVCKASA